MERQFYGLVFSSAFNLSVKASLRSESFLTWVLFGTNGLNADR
jgi:hypothetical protein